MRLAPFALLCALSLWLRANFPAVGVWAPIDDQLFIRAAWHLGSGAWLGPYDQLTHVKGLFYSLFILLNHVSGLPLKLSEHVLYLCASGFAAWSVSRLAGRAWVFWVVFVVLAFSPVAWTLEAARVVRESIYQSLSLLLFFSWARYINQERPGRWFGVGIGLIAGAYWLTREEGIWLIPALLVLALPRLLGALRGTRLERRALTARATDAARLLVPVMAPFILLMGVVSGLNYLEYGVFRDNDFRSGTPFTRAYAALSRIKHDQWRRYVVFPADARQRAYSVSPAARELEPFFEGDGGRFWIKASQHYGPPWGCPGQPEACVNEVMSGWFMWALRDAVASTGHYRSARVADRYYKRLAIEINSACERRLIPCGPPRSGMLPVWRDHYLADSLRASRDVLDTLVDYPRHPIGVPDSPLNARERARFEYALNSPVSGQLPCADPVSKSRGLRDQWRDAITRGVANVYAWASAPAFGLSLLAYAGLALAWLARPGTYVTTPGLVLATGLLAAILARVGLLGLLEATSIPSNNILYLIPVIPFYLMFIVVATSLALMAARAGWSARDRA